MSGMRTVIIAVFRYKRRQGVGRLHRVITAPIFAPTHLIVTHRDMARSKL